MNPDLRGVPTSAPESAALEAFEIALESLYRNRGEPLALIKPVLEQWPGWCLPHIFRAIVLLGFTERRFAAGAARSLERAEELLAGATDREREIYRAANHMLRGDWTEACNTFEQCLIANPLDMLALHAAQNLDFFRGDPWGLRNRVSRVLPAWTAQTPGYAFVLGMHAFGLEECNHYPQAEATARASLALHPENPWAVHALAHVLEMQGRIEEGIDHLTSGADLWAPDSGFAYHNWWHLALFHLDREDDDAVLALYDQQLAEPDARFALNMVDAAALLWRLHLLGIDVDDRVTPVAAWWRAQIGEGGAYYAFNDFHAALSFAHSGDGESLQTLIERLEREPVDSSRGRVNQTIGLPLVRAIADYAHGNYAACAAELARLRDHAQTFGGSHAQRDLITLTLMDAAARSGDLPLAAHYLNERRVMKPASPLSDRLERQYTYLAA